MKRFLFCIVMLFCMCMAMNAQGLKTYSGPYNDSRYMALDVPKATYTYKNAEDGTRIFEGNFTWQCTYRANVAYDRATGKFHNDNKVGLWTYTSKSKGSTTSLKVNYNNQGRVEGIYNYSQIEYNSKTGKQKVIRSLKANIKNGNAIGAISGHLVSFEAKEAGGYSQKLHIGDATFTGQTDDSGYADGIWKITMKYVSDAVDVFYVSYNHGSFKEAYCIDNTTGDKIAYESVNIKGAIHNLVSYNNSNLEGFVYRGSVPWDGIILDTDWVKYIKEQTAEAEDCEIVPKTDYEGYANDEAFILAKSQVPNILYKLNGTELKCVIDEYGNVTDIHFTKSPTDNAAKEELVRCLKLLKFKPAKRKGLNVKCKWNFWYDGNKSLLPEETEEQTSNVEAEKKVEDKVFDAVEQYPSFPGGEGAMFSYINNNLRYPQKAAENGVQGRVSVKFIVEKDGSISNVEVNRSVDTDLDNEAIRVIKSMPKWNPAKQNGTEVRAYYRVTVVFRLN